MVRTTRHVLLGSFVLAAAVLTGCTDGADSADAAAGPASSSAPAAAASAVPSASPAGAPTVDAATRSACTTIDAEIRKALKKVAEAEQIGPPAGHSAVSAQYSAGSASLYAQTFTPNAAVNDATKDVADAMGQLADNWAAAPGKAPSKAALNAAVQQLDTVCSAG